jgi:tetratricopeptide (TPR) repeat protein
VLLANGQPEKAIEFYEQQLTIARAIGSRQNEVTALGSLANAYSALGQLEKAIRFYEQALTISREITDRRSEGAALGSLGLAHAANGQPEKAISLLDQALQIGQELKDPELVEVATEQLKQLRGKESKGVLENQ